MHKVFVSFHHANDQWFKNYLVTWAKINDVFIDGSVEMGEIPDSWDDERIREYIRDEHLKDTTVTILLVGIETKYRKHVDWELYSSMYDGKVNKKSGIIVILLPSACSEYCTCSYESEKKFYPYKQWVSIDNKEEYRKRYPYVPERIIENLVRSDVRISVINWDKAISSPNILREMIDNAYNGRATCNYDLSTPMRRRNR